MAAADEDERVGSRPVGEGAAEPRQVGGDRRGKELDASAAGGQDLRDAGPERAEVDAVRVGEQPVQGEAVGVGAEAFAVRAEAQHQVEAAFRPGAAGERGGQVGGGAAVHGRERIGDGLGQHPVDDHGVHGSHGGPVGSAHPGDGEDEPGEDLALVQEAVVERDGGAGVADLVAYGECVEREVEVGALRRRRRRQHHMGVA